MYSNWADTQTLMQWTVLGLLNRNMSLMALVSDPPSLRIVIPFPYLFFVAKEQKRKTKLELPPTSVRQHFLEKRRKASKYPQLWFTKRRIPTFFVESAAKLPKLPDSKSLRRKLKNALNIFRPCLDTFSQS